MAILLTTIKKLLTAIYSVLALYGNIRKRVIMHKLRPPSILL